jgi:hypothetical protein
MPASGVVAVQEVRLLAPPPASLGLDENHRASRFKTRLRATRMRRVRLGSTLRAMVVEM